MKPESKSSKLSAVVLTLFFLIALPVMAWQHYDSEHSELAKREQRKAKNTEHQKRIDEREQAEAKKADELARDEKLGKAIVLLAKALKGLQGDSE